MARLTQEQWEAIRRCYEYDPDEPSPPAAAARVAAKLGFKVPVRQTIYNKMTAEGWSRRGVMGGIVHAAHRKADRVVTSTGEREPPPKPILPSQRPDRSTEAYLEREAAEDKRAEVIARHRMEWRQIAVLRQEALKLRESDLPGAERRAKLAKLVAETTKIQQDGERKAWGLDEPMAPPDFSKMSDADLRELVAGRFPQNMH